MDLERAMLGGAVLAWGLSHGIAIMTLAGTRVIQRSDWGWRMCFTVIPPHGWQVGNSCSWEASVSSHSVLSMGLLECSHNMVAGFPDPEQGI